LKQVCQREYSFSGKRKIVIEARLAVCDGQVNFAEKESAIIRSARMVYIFNYIKFYGL